MVLNYKQPEDIYKLLADREVTDPDVINRKKVSVKIKKFRKKFRTELCVENIKERIF